MTRITLAKIKGNKTVDLAVDEIYCYLKRIDRDLFVDVRTYSDYDATVEKVIWVGESEELSKLLLDVSDKKLDDSIYINIDNNEGVITGSNPRAVLIASYRFLRELGVAWVRPTDDGELVPELAITDINMKVKEKASYRHRAICIEGSVSYENVLNMIKWIPRVGMSGYFFQFFRPYEFFTRWYEHKRNKYLAPEYLSRGEVSAMVDSLSEEIEKRGLLLHKVGHGWTCEPFGFAGDGWSTNIDEVSEDKKKYLAMIDGERGFFRGVPLNTNLCYSNSEVRDILTTAMANYCEDNREVKYLHFWLADDRNNACECENCTERLSDYFVMMLNEVDKKLSEKNVDTKIVFLIYLDLFWAPLKEKLNNPDRFVLMFAPISRSYSYSFDEVDVTKSVKVPEYNKNKSFPICPLDQNVEFLKSWKKIHSGDSFDFDYHLMWDHLYDLGYAKVADILFRDMKTLHNIGLDGMVSCQLTKCAFPTNLPMQLMADVLWDENADIGKCSDKYYLDAFGEDGKLVREYLERISDCINPHYSRYVNERPYSVEKRFKEVKEIYTVLSGFEDVIQKNLEKALPEAQNMSWKYLEYHKTYTKLYADCIVKSIEEGEESKEKAIASLMDYLWQNEKDLYKVFDPMFVQGVVRNASK